MKMQRRALVIFVVITVLVLLVSGTALAGGPVEKATGRINVFEPTDGGHREVTLNAREGTATRAAKGRMVDRAFGADGIQRRMFKYDVKYVRVDGDFLYFGALCTYDSHVGVKVGEWLYVKAYDGGTPGIAGDYIGWRWASNESTVIDWVNIGPVPYWWRIAIDGDLKVHTY